MYTHLSLFAKYSFSVLLPNDLIQMATLALLLHPVLVLVTNTLSNSQALVATNPPKAPVPQTRAIPMEKVEAAIRLRLLPSTPRVINLLNNPVPRANTLPRAPRPTLKPNLVETMATVPILVPLVLMRMKTAMLLSNPALLTIVHLQAPTPTMSLVVMDEPELSISPPAPALLWMPAIMPSNSLAHQIIMHLPVLRMKRTLAPMETMVVKPAPVLPALA